MDKARTELVAVLIIIAAGGVLGYSSLFHYRAYVDEYTYARLGYSLAHGHLASDSTYLSTYQEYGLVTNSIVTPYGYVDSVEPWLDHPPLVGILLVPVFDAGANPRVLPLVLYSATTLLLFFALSKFDRIWALAAVVAAELYLQTFPILSMLFLDSAVSFFMVLTMTGIIYHLKSASERALYIAGVSAGLAALSKVPGVAAMIAFLIYVVYLHVTKKATFRQTSIPLTISVAIGLAWPVGGFLAEPGLFWQLNMENFSRSVLSGNSLDQLLTTFVSSASFTKDNYATVVDPVLIVSWLAAAYAVIVRKSWFAGVTLGSYLLVMLVLRYPAPQMTIPFFPFYAIGTAALVADLARLVRDRIARRTV